MGGIRKTIALLPGDGIGPEIIGAATRLLEDCAAEFGHQFELIEFPLGGTAIDRCGTPLPAETLDGCRKADAVLLGAVGGPQWDALPLGKRPESGLLALRQELGLFINVRPIRLRSSLRGISPLRPDRARKFDFEIVRELAGGIYFGEHRVSGTNGGERASDVETYSSPEIERVARYAFKRAEKRCRRLASVDKANVLASSVLWRKTVSRLASDYPSVALEHVYVDNAAMQLILRPGEFDVIVTSNLFGDILSDEAAALLGSIGLVPSMSLGEGVALYEPIHGSAPTLAGKNLACPLGAISCVSMMLKESFGLEVEPGWVEAAVDRVLDRGYRTADLAEPDSKIIGCSAMTELIRTEMGESLLHTERYGWGV
jgi:3-isopropylmalate dehydrogenase